MRTLNIFLASSALALSAALPACSDLATDDYSPKGSTIIASIAEPTDTRTMVDGDPADDVLGILWSDGDQIGVFDADGNNHTLFQKEGTGAAAKAAFSTKESTITPYYAYYPYSADNNGKTVTSLSGAIPTTQNMDDNNIDGDYKYGVAKSTDDDYAYYFEFAHIFSLVKAEINATGSPLEGETLSTIEVSATRNESPVSIAGEFSFNARNGSYTLGSDLYSSICLNWEKGASLESVVTGYMSLFPNIRIGDNLTFKVTTDKHIATFTVTVKVNFLKENVYLFPLDISRFTTEEYGYALTDTEGNPVTDTETDSETITGTFTCATYNVDGLPDINYLFGSTNPDGPGESGTSIIAKAANDSGWDFFGVSEDFEYHSILLEGLTNYNAGTWRGTVTLDQLSTRADTDGLCFFWNNTIQAENETYVQFTHEYGGLTGGANTCIKKGFRYYLVTLKDGTQIDVYITHMNTYSSSSESNYLAAANGQLTEIANYVIAHQNGRPIIIMGDTNCRYTRHLIKTNLIDVINAESNLEIIDPWCSLAWNNDFSSVGGDTYPPYPSNSLMVSDASGTSNSDIIIKEAEGGLQKGEVVDKVFYINCKDAKTQISAKSYLRDISFKDSDGTALADHYPIVVQFEYTTTK